MCRNRQTDRPEKKQYNQYSVKMPKHAGVTTVCTKSFVGWAFAPDPTRGAYSAPPDAIAGFWGPYF